MSTNKRVILQQDLPGAMKGTEVLYDTERVLYYIRGTLYKWSRGLIEGDDGKWFKLEEILLEEKSFNKYRGNLKDDHGRIIFTISECGKYIVEEYKGKPVIQKNENFEIISIENHGEIFGRDSAIFWTAFQTTLPINIMSVKRPSDGEIFIVGHEVLNYEGYPKRITGFDFSARGTNIEVKFSNEKIDYNWLYQIKRFPLPSTNIPEDKKPELLLKLKERYPSGIVLGGAGAIVGDVGVMIEWINPGGETKQRKFYESDYVLSVIEFVNDKLLVVADGKTAYVHPSHFKGIKFYDKPVLFVTEDGQPVYDRVPYWTINKYDWNVVKRTPNVEQGTFLEKWLTSGRFPHHAFSTQEKANEYIAWNKPQFSLAEIMSRSRWYSGDGETEKHIFLREELIKLAKSKQGLPATEKQSSPIPQDGKLTVPEYIAKGMRESNLCKENEQKTERIGVTEIKAEGFSDHGNWYRFHIARSPGKEWPTVLKAQVPAIKSAIEWVINEDEGKPGEIAVWAAIKVLEQSDWLCMKRILSAAKQRS